MISILDHRTHYALLCSSDRVYLGLFVDPAAPIPLTHAHPVQWTATATRRSRPSIMSCRMSGPRPRITRHAWESASGTNVPGTVRRGMTSEGVLERRTLMLLHMVAGTAATFSVLRCSHNMAPCICPKLSSPVSERSTRINPVLDSHCGWLCVCLRMGTRQRYPWSAFPTRREPSQSGIGASCSMQSPNAGRCGITWG